MLDLGLTAAVTDICRDQGLDATVDLPQEQLPDTVEYIAFLLVSEALTNVLKHAGTIIVNVAGRISDKALIIVVSDNGRGGAKPGGSDGKNQGLISIADRLTALQGSMHIASEPGHGTRLEMRIPCV